MAQRYPYPPLNASEHQIRLLTLVPGEFPLLNEAASPIEIQFQTISFVAVNSLVPMPKYEALPYAWGEERSPIPVIVKSYSSERSFVEVPQNLATALIYLRYKSEARVLWIDALCINQEDVVERSSQVARMADIYRLAHRVVIEVDWNLFEMRATDQGDSSLADIDILLTLDQHFLSSLLMVINRPWFERLWVKQEIALADENAVLVCGHDSITRRHFMNAIFCIRSKVPIPGWDRIGDRIFAVLSTRNPRDKQVNIEVDYSKTTEEVYRQFAVRNILSRNSLSLLAACEVKTDHEGMQKPMPSWVPDWRRRMVTERLPKGFASGGSAAAAQFDRKMQTMTVSGVKCATVAHVKHTNLGLRSKWLYDHDFTENVKKCIQFWGLSEWYLTGETAHEAHIRTLCGNHFSDSYHPLSPNLLSYGIYSSEIERFLQERAVEETENFTEQRSTSQTVASIFDACRGRSCFTTTEGYIGLAPAETNSGDIICVLLGSEVPIVLRSQGEEKYSVVGECYCHGITDGSALLGPMPVDFEHVINFVQDWVGDFDAFIDRCSGKVQGEDPRLAGYPLPTGWRIETSHEAATVEFVQDHYDGTEKKRTEFDPRMTADELRKRGVDVLKFDLI